MNGRDARPERPAYLRFIPGFLFAQDPVAARYIGRAWLLSLIPSILLSILVASLLPQAEQPNLSADTPVSLLLLVVGAPVLETLILVPPLLLLARFLGPGPAVVVNALLWGAVHSLSAPAWGLVTWWPFLVMSIALLTWRHAGLVRAMLIVIAIHALQNSVGAALLLLR
jgi:membrane protease YdiL (CAAX protease family)